MTILLFTHIVIASLLTISVASLLVFAMLRKSATLIAYISQGSFGATLLSGVALVVVTPQSFTHLCAMMTVYSLATFGVVALYKKRVHQPLSPQENSV